MYKAEEFEDGKRYRHVPTNKRSKVIKLPFVDPNRFRDVLFEKSGDTYYYHIDTLFIAFPVDDSRIKWLMDQYFSLSLAEEQRPQSVMHSEVDTIGVQDKPSRGGFTTEEVVNGLTTFCKVLPDIIEAGETLIDAFESVGKNFSAIDQQISKCEIKTPIIENSEDYIAPPSEVKNFTEPKDFIDGKHYSPATRVVETICGYDLNNQEITIVKIGAEYWVAKYGTPVIQIPRLLESPLAILFIQVEPIEKPDACETVVPKEKVANSPFKATKDIGTIESDEMFEQFIYSAGKLDPIGYQQKNGVAVFFDRLNEETEAPKGKNELKSNVCLEDMEPKKLYRLASLRGSYDTVAGIDPINAVFSKLDLNKKIVMWDVEAELTVGNQVYLGSHLPWKDCLFTEVTEEDRGPKGEYRLAIDGAGNQFPIFLEEGGHAGQVVHFDDVDGDPALSRCGKDDREQQKLDAMRYKFSASFDNSRVKGADAIFYDEFETLGDKGNGYSTLVYVVSCIVCIGIGLLLGFCLNSDKIISALRYGL